MVVIDPSGQQQCTTARRSSKRNRCATAGVRRREGRELPERRGVAGAVFGGGHGGLVFAGWFKSSEP
jgi:hypothetical protein